MSIGDLTSRFLVSPNSLRKLAGHDDELKLLEYMGDDYFDQIGDETMSVEIMTLSQHQYELAFEHLATQDEFAGMELEDMSDHVDAILSQFTNIVPHIKVHTGEITVVVDCTKIDTQIVEYVSQLLSIIPSLKPGFYWEYLNPEK